MSTWLHRKYRVLWLQPVKDWHFVGGSRPHCCEDLRAAVGFQCVQHEDPFEGPDYLIAYNEITDEYGLAIRDGASSVLIIRHCPFCGANFPERKAERWFDEIDALGLSGPTDENMPAAFKADAWWRETAQREGH